MTTGNTIEIVDKDGFPSKIAAVRDAVTQLRGVRTELELINSTVVKEASSFTADGSPAPVYGPVIEALRDWAEAFGAATETVCASAENCAATAESKFTAITTTDSAAAAAVNDI